MPLISPCASPNPVMLFIIALHFQFLLRIFSARYITHDWVICRADLPRYFRPLFQQGLTAALNFAAVGLEAAESEAVERVAVEPEAAGPAFVESVEAGPGRSR